MKTAVLFLPFLTFSLFAVSALSQEFHQESEIPAAQVGAPGFWESYSLPQVVHSFRSGRHYPVPSGSQASGDYR